jgi:hypothetical protein
MADPIEFIRNPILYIKSDSIPLELQDSLYDTISEYQTDTDVSYEFEDDNLYPINRDYSPNDLVDVIKTIIKYLNKNRIKWEGGKTTFMYGDEHGFIVITKDNAIIGYIDDEGEVEKEYIPLTENRRL